MAAVFERIRAAVLQEATRPLPYDAKQHADNQAAFTEKLENVCDPAGIAHGEAVRKNAHLRADMTADDLWWQVWTKIRYAGFKAAYVTCEIDRLTPFFKDFRVLTAPEWRFVDQTGGFADISYSPLRPKLHKILKAAAAFQAFPPGAQALAALFGDDYDKPGDEALWRAHTRLAELVGYTTALQCDDGHRL
jgi:hypothetical protein